MIYKCSARSIERDTFSLAHNICLKLITMDTERFSTVDTRLLLSHNIPLRVIEHIMLACGTANREHTRIYENTLK